MILDPDKVPRVAVDSMNDVHLEEVAILNAFDTLLEAYDASDDATARIDAELAAIVEHQRDHFASEEQLMQETGFPAFPMHQQEHDRQLAVVAAIVDRWTRTRDVEVLREFFREDLPAWVAQHILTMDTITAQFVAARS